MDTKVIIICKKCFNSPKRIYTPWNEFCDRRHCQCSAMLTQVENIHTHIKYSSTTSHGSAIFWRTPSPNNISWMVQMWKNDTKCVMYKIDEPWQNKWQ